MYRQRHPDDPGMHNFGERRYTHRERGETFLDRLWANCFVSLVGVVLVPLAIVLLAYNEGRAVQTAKSLDEGLASVTELKSNQIVEPHLNGKLVHLSGHIHCDGFLRDEKHGVAVNAVSLRRSVEMYQWVETEHRDEEELPNGDKEITKSYSYDTAWRSDVVHSNSFDSPFQHKNPDSMPFTSETWSTSKVNLGAFSLSHSLVAGINHYMDIKPSVVPENSDVKIRDKYLYYSSDPQYPKVGDVRVSFSYAGLCRDNKLGPSQMISVMAMQQNFMLTGYQTQAGNEIEMISLSQKSAPEMVESAHAENKMLTWMLRGLGLFVNFLGFTCLTSPVRALVSYIPLVRELVYTSVVAFNVSMSVSLSLTTIAISWIIYRPLMAFSILALALAFILVPRVSVQPPPSRRYYT